MGLGEVSPVFTVGPVGKVRVEPPQYSVPLGFRLLHLFMVVLELAPEVSNLSQTFLPRPMVLWALGPTGLASLPLPFGSSRKSASCDHFSYRLKTGLGFAISSLSLSSLLLIQASLLLDPKLLCVLILSLR